MFFAWQELGDAQTLGADFTKSTMTRGAETMSTIKTVGFWLACFWIPGLLLAGYLFISSAIPIRSSASRPRR